jgi:hypothetical protein
VTSQVDLPIAAAFKRSAADSRASSSRPSAHADAPRFEQHDTQEMDLPVRRRRQAMAMPRRLFAADRLVSYNSNEQRTI